MLIKSVLVTKLDYFNLTASFSAVNLLNSGVVIYLAWAGISFSTFPIFILRTVVTELRVSGFVLNFTNFCTENSCSH